MHPLLYASMHPCTRTQRFSSVVGPNGSGKSNVIDAMLFVFGKRAAQMRLKKLPELIHRSDAYPDLEFAQVSVHFQEIIDYLVRVARVRRYLLEIHVSCVCMVVSRIANFMNIARLSAPPVLNCNSHTRIFNIKHRNNKYYYHAHAMYILP